MATDDKITGQQSTGHIGKSLDYLWQRRTVYITGISLSAIAAYLIMRFGVRTSEFLYELPLFITLAVGGIPLIYELVKKVAHRELGSDLLAGISIITAVFLGEYLAGAIVVLMLSGGDALETYAIANASSVLRALAKRVPSVAHRKVSGQVKDISLPDVAVGDILIVFPHEICPVDGVVVEGHGTMDESFLTGEPFQIQKTPGVNVISGAVNADSALTISAQKLPVDSRYAKIMQVMRASEQNRPQLRRLGDQLGAIYTPIALLLASFAWLWTANADRFLAVLVIATPCPLLIGIPVAIIGSVSLAARRAIIIKNPAILEQIDACETIIFDKTGTLTYGEPKLIEQRVAPGFDSKEVLSLAASLELYSKHPLAQAILRAAKDLEIADAQQISEPPGHGLSGQVQNHHVRITHRGNLTAQKMPGLDQFPPPSGGLECMVVIDGRLAAAYSFRDAPRTEGFPFIQHLGWKHHFRRVMIVSGDRESEVRYLAEQVGIKDVHAQRTPEQKLEIVRQETRRSKTVYVGDGINDAPAMMAATVGIAIGQNSDITTEAADVVVMEEALKKVDELIHVGHRMRRIALETAIGGMSLSVLGMAFAAAGLLVPVEGAIAQEVIDLLAVLNALRAAVPPKAMSDFE